ncbi:hypothetical protein ALC56_10464 [Trachymyrmex septentrionalis]|uniref:Uncharacterized protein n=1 Tax=Trachymyrmex septentrionalis TaxID=34720 RepID=A0A195F5E1_9HYME|nr:PREDICTED: uncharacterized protein LOC108751941 [Trachymyrmex septentrionalis]KYN35289.1 hypothetical protein ALC56_10464 [Trachymyrmex septentrionalis]
MITMENDITKRPHFRLKVDLSKFFYDARRSCWIFVDGMKIQQINHLKQHISKLFNIAEPFHLLLNDTEYLPPIEDVRILKENETILVVPGSGINNEALAVVETNHVSIFDKQALHTATNIKTGKQEIIVQNTFNDTLNNTQPASINNTTKDMPFYSVISDTVVNCSEEDTDFKTTDNLTENCNGIDSIVSITKRKRVRKRKPKNQSQFIVSPSNRIEENISKEPKLKKPKIIDSYIIPSGKHIRFDDIESDEHNIARQIAVQEASRNHSELNETSSSKDLSTLLALGQSLTPITFINKKLKNDITTENVLNDEISKNVNKIMEDSTEKNLCSKESKKEIQNYKNLYADLEKVPIMTRKPQVNDIIAFKTLKIGTDYTPQVSNSVLAEVVACVQGNYTLRILHGKEEIQEVPFGKFSLSEEESKSQPDGETLILNYSQMIEPRLI